MHARRGTPFMLVVGLLLGGMGPAAAVTRSVPAEYATINNALDASAFADTVLVAPGIYTDYEIRGSGIPRSSCAFMVDGVVLRSEGGPEVTTLDMQGVSLPQASVVNAEGLPSEATVVEGFTLTGAPIGGKGAYVVGSGKVTFRGCIFRDLDAGQSTGAGLVADGNVDVVDCEFVNCIADAGGAILASTGHLNLIRTTIRECGNKGAYLLGVAGGPGESALIEDCLFLNNWSSNAAAGLHISRYDQGATVRRCRFEGNVAYGSGGGGLGWGNYGPKVVEDCLFLNNATTGSNGQGGALIIGDNGSCVIRGNTFYGNSQVLQLAGGAAVYVAVGGTAQFERNVVSHSIGQAAMYVLDGSGLNTSCNVFWDNADGIGIPLGDTDREVDPEFCDPETADFTVRENSPCVEPGSLGCGQIGAFGIGCGVVSVEPESWGWIKSLHRRGEGP